MTLTFKKSTFFCLGIFSACAVNLAAAQQTSFRVNAIEERKNAVVNIDNGMVAALGNPQTLNGIIGTTKDFKGQEFPAYIVFNQSVPESRLMGLAEFQGKLAGAVSCQLIRLGSSPDLPAVKVAVLAQNCTVKTLNH